MSEVTYYDVMRSILALKITPRAKVVLLYLYDRQGSNGKAWPSWATICRECGLSKNTVSKAMAELKEAKILTVQTPDKPARNATNSYAVCADRFTRVDQSTHIESNRSTRVDSNQSTRVETNDSYNVSMNDSYNKHKGRRKKFTKPSPTEVTEYAASIGYALDGETFCDYYQSKGWLVGKTPMKDWKAAVRTWKRNDAKRNGQTESGAKADRRGTKKRRSFEGLQSDFGTEIEI